MKTESHVWKFFHKDKSNPKNIKATCKKCNKTFQGIKKRLIKHLNECNGQDEASESDDDVIMTSSIAVEAKKGI